jgi:SsrA-binding protein
MRNRSSNKTIAQNKRARYDYDILTTYQAGIVLEGFEVKSSKSGQMSLKESFIRVENGEVWLINAHIGLWQHAQVPDYDPTRRRKLLLSKREIRNLTIQQDAKRMSLVPIKAFIKKGRVKILFGVGKGRKKYDKRRKIKEREMKKQIDSDLAKKDRF